MDNFIWIGSDKMSLLQGKYLPSAVIVLTNSPKIPHITKRDILELNFPRVMKKYGKRAVVQIQAVYMGPISMWLWKGFLNRGFLNIYIIMSFWNI